MATANEVVVAEEQVLRALQERLDASQVVYPGGRAADLRVESCSLAVLALRNHPCRGSLQALNTLLATRNPDGSWPAFSGDDAQGSWATALAILALAAVRHTLTDWGPGIQWLLDAKGREANWFWRWKFQNVDNGVKFDPAKYGWSWVPGTTSWVIPTAFSLIALQKASDTGLTLEPRFSERISVGTSMLLDRMCPGGGWNAGNSAAFGVAYAPYIDATAIALLALRRHEHQPGIRESLSWLAARLPGCRSPYSLAWGILGITAYGRRGNETGDPTGRATDELIAALGNTAANLDTSTIATCALALEAIEGKNVFEVGR